MRDRLPSDDPKLGTRAMRLPSDEPARLPSRASRRGCLVVSYYQSHLSELYSPFPPHEHALRVFVVDDVIFCLCIEGDPGLQPSFSTHQALKGMNSQQPLFFFR